MLSFLWMTVPILSDPGIDLKIAVKKMDLEGVKKAIASGADVNQSDKYGFAPIHYAAGMASEEILLYLIKKGAQVNKKVIRLKMNALHIAAMNGKEKNIEVLIEANADQNLIDIDSKKPIDYATESQNKGRCENCTRYFKK